MIHDFEAKVKARTADGGKIFEKTGEAFASPLLRLFFQKVLPIAPRISMIAATMQNRPKATISVPASFFFCLS